MSKLLCHSYLTAEEEIIFPFCKPDMSRAWRPANTDYTEFELQNDSQSLLVTYGVTHGVLRRKQGKIEL